MKRTSLNNYESSVNMTCFAESIFDDNDKFNLWKKYNDEVEIKKEKVLYCSTMLKKTTESKSFSKKYFFITQNYLYYKNSQKDKNIEGWTKINWMRVLFDSEVYNKRKPPGMNKESDKDIYCIRLIRNRKYIQLYTKDHKTYLEWYETQRSLIIQTDFNKVYELLHDIDKGAFAKVVAVEHRQTNKIYAVKVFDKKEISKKDKDIECLKNEIAILRKLDSDTVCKFYEVHETINEIYLVLEYMKGGFIFDHGKVKKFGLPAVVHCIKSILQSLAYLNQINVMHRDLKPSNIMFEEKEPNLESSPIKLIDFGLSAFLGQHDYVFKRCGTPGFVAPEVIKTRETDDLAYDCKCDVYSVGIIMYYMLSGILPFNHPDVKKTIMQNKEGKIAYDIKEFAKYKETNAMYIMQKMLTYDANERPTAQECLKHPFFKQYFDSLGSTAFTNASTESPYEKKNRLKSFDWTPKNHQQTNTKEITLLRTIDGHQTKTIENSDNQSSDSSFEEIRLDISSNKQNTKNFRIQNKKNLSEYRFTKTDNDRSKTPVKNKTFKINEDEVSVSRKSHKLIEKYFKTDNDSTKTPVKNKTFKIKAVRCSTSRDSHKSDEKHSNKKQFSDAACALNTPKREKYRSLTPSSKKDNGIEFHKTIKSNRMKYSYSGLISDKVKKDLLQINQKSTNNIKFKNNIIDKKYHVEMGGITKHSDTYYTDIKLGKSLTSRIDSNYPQKPISNLEVPENEKKNANLDSVLKKFDTDSTKGTTFVKKVYKKSKYFNNNIKEANLPNNEKQLE